MEGLRRAVRRIAVVWLLCHGASLTLPAAVLWAGASEQLVECRCAHGDHSLCPMHHDRKPRPTCAISSAADDDVAIVSWLLGAGLEPARTVTPELRDPQHLGLPDVAAADLRPVPPDPPPPRA
jgi:hypothetical protein